MIKSVVTPVLLALLFASPAIAKPRIVGVGDSLIGQVSSSSKVKENSYRQYSHQRSLISWFQALTNSAYDMQWQWRGQVNARVGTEPATGADQGYGGQTSDQVLARLQRDALSQSPEICLIQMGTNDLSKGASASSIIANYKRAVDMITASGAQAWVFTLFPRSGAYALSPGNEKSRDAVNAWIRSIPSLYPGKVQVLDADAALGGDVLDSNYTYDGLHLNSRGAAQVAGAVMLPKIQALTDYAKARRDLPLAFDANTNIYGNILLNSAFAGTSGTLGDGAAGVAPDNWMVARAAGDTASVQSAVSQQTNWNGDSAPFLDLTVTTAGNGADNEQVVLTARDSSGKSSLLTSGVALGEQYEAEVEVIVEKTSKGANPLRSLYLEVRDTTNNGTYQGMFAPRFSAAGYTDFFPDDKQYRLVLRTNPFWAKGVAGFNWRLLADLDGRVAGTRVIRVGQPVFRRATGYVEEVTVLKKQRWEKFTADQDQIVIPARHYIRDVIIHNTTPNAVDGGIRIGTIAGAGDVVSAFPVAGHATKNVGPALLRNTFSYDSPQVLYFEAVKGWNGAALNVTLLLDEY